ncbi:putative protein MISP3 [Channa argus]|uniref:A-kinase anchor protein 2 C-terminal domain-containing protein n=1 Tax=Channa argus TaxID=215402 RepID=A0A6G1PBG0_CHAAH|nr:putative protein MISP3 [Channa argus]KAK2919087.1 hypothetical protein Q8A73_003458 [Channa argus]
MATKPAAWHGQGPVNSLNNESWAQGEISVTISHDSPLQNKKAPRAEPEEDIEILEPRPQHKALQEKQTFRRIEIPDGTKLENQESTRISLYIPRETQDIVTELEQVPNKVSETLEPQEETEKSVAQSKEEVFPHPPSILLGSLEKEAFSSLEGEVGEGISDAEIISDSTEDLMSPDSHRSQKGLQTALLIESAGRMLDSTSEEMTEDNMTAEESDTHLHFSPDGCRNSKAENYASGAAHHSPSDSNSSGDGYTMHSLPFAGESEEEEEVNIVVKSQEQWASTDVVPTQSDPASSLPVVPTTNQQEELLIQSQREPALRGRNQEAAQQVHSQLSTTVSIEVSNQGGALSQGCGCVVAQRESYTRAGDCSEAESEQTSRGEGRKESVFEKSKVNGQEQARGRLSYSKTFQTQELQTEEYICGVSLTHNRCKMETDSCDDSQSDSGVSADFSPCSTLEGNTTISVGTSTSSVPNETPIEKEIRRAVEREHSLRRSRGLPNPSKSPEYVDIPVKKTDLCQSFTAKSEKYHSKDRQFAGKKMQHEIHQETQREQDLVKIGKVPGFYDKGTVRQLKDRKQIFEAFLQLNDSTLTVSTRSKAPSWSSASDISGLENHEYTSLQPSTIGCSYGERRQSIDLLSPTQSHNSVKLGSSTDVTPQGPGFSEATNCQVIILENNLSIPALKLYHTKQQANPVTVVDSGCPHLSSPRSGGQGGTTRKKKQEKVADDGRKDEEVSKDNPFFKLRSSTNLVKLEQDIKEAQEREKELRKQRISLYGDTGGPREGGEVRPASVEGKNSTWSPPSENGLPVPDLPGSLSSMSGTGPSAACQSLGKLGMWPPAQAEKEKITQSEVLQSPRTPRQKTPLIQRWESGLVNGHKAEDD